MIENILAFIRLYAAPLVLMVWAIAEANDVPIALGLLATVIGMVISERERSRRRCRD